MAVNRNASENCNGFNGLTHKFQVIKVRRRGPHSGARRRNTPMPLSDHGRVRKQQFHDRLGILHHRTLHRKL